MPDVITFTSEGDDPSGRRRQGVDRPDAAPVRPAQGCELGVPPVRKTRPPVVTGSPCASRMIPLESPVPETGTPGSESGGRKRAHGNRTAAWLRKRRTSHRFPTGYAPLLDSTKSASRDRQDGPSCTTLAGMAMGRVRDDGSQQSMWVATADLPQSAGHPFYERLNRILEAAGFDAFVEGLCGRVKLRHETDAAKPGVYSCADPRSSGRKLGRPKGSLGVSRLDGKEDEIRRFLELGASKIAIAKITGVSRTTLYSFMSIRGLRPTFQATGSRRYPSNGGAQARPADRRATVAQDDEALRPDSDRVAADEIERILI